LSFEGNPSGIHLFRGRGTVPLHLPIQHALKGVLKSVLQALKAAYWKLSFVRVTLEGSYIPVPVQQVNMFHRSSSGG